MKLSFSSVIKRIKYKNGSNEAPSTEALLYFTAFCTFVLLTITPSARSIYQYIIILQLFSFIFYLWRHRRRRKLRAFREKQNSVDTASFEPFLYFIIAELDDPLRCALRSLKCESLYSPWKGHYSVVCVIQADTGILFTNLIRMQSRLSALAEKMVTRMFKSRQSRESSPGPCSTPSTFCLRFCSKTQSYKSTYNNTLRCFICLASANTSGKNALVRAKNSRPLAKPKEFSKNQLVKYSLTNNRGY